jgi:glycosyltransferase involved in cell wall biosynthesis
VRVGLLIYGSLNSISGGYLYDRKLVDHLRNHGDSVEIISLPWRNYPLHLLDNFSKPLMHKLQQLPVELLIQDELNHPSLAWLNHRLHPHFTTLSLVHHLRCDELRPAWQNNFYRQVERRYLQNVDGFIFNSQSTRQSVDRESKINDRPCVVAYPAGNQLRSQIEAAEIEKRAHLSGALRLIFLGNLIPRKGLHVLVEALARLPEASCTLDVVGGIQVDPAYTRSIQRQIKGLRLKQSIRFHDFLDDNALASLLNDNQILVVPSSYEGFGIVYLEGMGFGLPAIGTTQGAASEIITSGKNGYLINPEDSQELANILQRLHQNRQHLAALSLAAHNRNAEFPSWEQSMAKVRTFLLEVVNKQPETLAWRNQG